jgi:hypothetical protein
MPVAAGRRTWHVAAIVALAIFLPGCHLMSTGRVIYDVQDTRVGLEPDPTLSRRDSHVFNNHPAALTPGEIASLLSVVRVSGWSGTLVGILATPTPVPLLTPTQLSRIAGPLSQAFQDAAPSERLTFSLPKPDVAYSEDRTEGALFLRGRYLHIVVTDHSSVLRADTGGGDVRDIRDTKGMKLWIEGPAQAAMVPDAEEPRWPPFESVHISLHVKDVLALAQARSIAGRSSPDRTASPGPGAATAAEGGGPAPSRADLQLQIRELTQSNLELRERLQEQTKKMEELTHQLEGLHRELDKSRSRKLPGRKDP